MTLFNKKGKLNEFLLSYVAQVNAEQPNVHINLELVKSMYQYPDDVTIVREGLLWTNELEEGLKLHQYTLHQGKESATYVNVLLDSDESRFLGKAYKVPNKEDHEKVDLIIDLNSFKKV